ncbi:conjugal transfer protein [Antribacter gilvus]|uniref:conjugal transfer protein n=1 Tax=Antribacter gilvus TaxID=2304675 RepID=UPI0013DFA89C|nr:conjugal transfer protein [Antribacter gilvus]
MTSLLVRRRDRRGAPATLPASAGQEASRAPGAGDPPSGDDQDGVDGELPQVVEWTQGPAMVTKAWAVALGVAIACGPLALAWVALRPAPAATSVASGGTQYAASSAAGERAVELVETWLRADRDDQQLVESLVAVTVATLPETGLTIRDSSVAQVAPQGGGTWSVTVGVDVAEPAPVAAGATPPAEPSLVWVRRYFQVPVHVAVTDESVAVDALALPAPVPGPAAATAPELDYPETISPTGEAGQSVASFLAAMLAADGDITRYTRPGAAISAVQPAPYSAVTVRNLSGSHEAPDEPGEGDGTYVLATAELTRPDGQKTTSQYTLTLVARDGRWEVAGVDSAVRIKENPGTGTAGQETEGESS